MEIYIWETRDSVNETQAEFFENKPNLLDNSHLLWTLTAVIIILYKQKPIQK